jgi:putative conjugative transposon membrane protein
MIGLLLLVLILFVGMFKLIALFSIKITAFAIDFFLIFFFTILYYLHWLISVKILSGNAVYFWDFVLGLVAVVIYGVVILFIHHMFPNVSKILNYVISFMGVSVVIPLAISFATSFINMINSNVKATNHIQLFNNATADKIVYIVMFILLAIPV